MATVDNFKRRILIINGRPRSGKDTFYEILSSMRPALKTSSVTKIKEIARICGWDGKSKTEKDRKFLSDLKFLLTEYNDLPYRDLVETIRLFQHAPYKYLLIDIREQADIERFQMEFGAYSVLIHNDRVPMVTTNAADANVENIVYDYTVENNGTLHEFRKNIEKFLKEIENDEKH